MLDGEEAKQECINEKRANERDCRAGVNCFRNDQIAYKADCIESRGEKDQVTDSTIHERERSPHGRW